MSVTPTMESVKMIVARSQNGVIGRKGDIPWRLKDDMRFFKQTTEGNTVVMGRKTYDSIGRPLPNRHNIVVSRDKTFDPEGVTVVNSPEKALHIPRQGDLFVIGGQQIYEALLHVTQTVYLTVVDAHLSGDAFFPDLSEGWVKTLLRHHEADDNNDFSFTIYRAERNVTSQ